MNNCFMLFRTVNNSAYAGIRVISNNWGFIDILLTPLAIKCKVLWVCDLFFNVYLFIERACACVRTREGQREREGENLKQAPHCKH